MQVKRRDGVGTGHDPLETGSIPATRNNYLPYTAGLGDPVDLTRPICD